jgi:hypothetical protein
MTTFAKSIIVIFVLLVAVIGVWAYASGVFAPTAVATPNNQNATSTPTAQTTSIKLAFLDTSSTSTGKERGCDRVVMVTRDVPATNAPLTAAIQSLFAEPSEQVGGNFNFIARTKSTLKFNRATVENGTASIYLTGNLSGLAGVCDDPRTQIQIEETALQFATVQKVDIYLNSEKTSLTPSQQ